jgi:hypothetical protein
MTVQNSNSSVRLTRFSSKGSNSALVFWLLVSVSPYACPANTNRVCTFICAHWHHLVRWIWIKKRYLSLLSQNPPRKGTWSVFGFSVTMCNDFGKSGLNYTNFSQAVVCGILAELILNSLCTLDVKNVIILARGADLLQWQKQTDETLSSSITINYEQKHSWSIK